MTNTSIQRSVNSPVPGRLIYVIGDTGDTYYTNWMRGRLTDRMEDASFVVATGGQDIDPKRYGRHAHYSTSYSQTRDAYEFPLFDKAKALGKPLVGICRGSQALCVWSGGVLVQDQANPQYIHDIETYDGKTIIVSSTHHQAQYPWALPTDEFAVLGWSTGISPYHSGETDDDELVIGKVPGKKEVEIAVYRKTRALAIQSHPEGLLSDYHRDEKVRESIDYMRGLLDAHLANTL